MIGTADSLPRAEHAFLLQLQIDSLQYFLDNQTPCGLILDRQRNHGARRSHGLCSTATTGMGLIALALAAQPPYRLLTPAVAAERIRAALSAALARLPHDHGIMPHFVHSATGRVHGNDRLSTIDSAWLIAGGLWSAALLQDSALQALAMQLYERVDWQYWAAPEKGDGRGLLRHGMGANGTFLGSSWDRLNGETIFMYVIAAGAVDRLSIQSDAWKALEPFYGTVADLRFNNADLGLFVFQYGLDLLDLTAAAVGQIDLWAEARVATTANYQACRRAADRFVTYRRFWGISAGDGPGEPPSDDAYRCYTPAEALDGTAHLSATLAAVAHGPEIVLENLLAAQGASGMGARGRYGFSNINIDRGWVGRDMIGIDAGAAVLALDNYLMNNRVRGVFHDLPCVRRGLERLGLTGSGGRLANDSPEKQAPQRLAS